LESHLQGLKTDKNTLQASLNFTVCLAGTRLSLQSYDTLGARKALSPKDGLRLKLLRKLGYPIELGLSVVLLHLFWSSK